MWINNDCTPPWAFTSWWLLMAAIHETASSKTAIQPVCSSRSINMFWFPTSLSDIKKYLLVSFSNLCGSPLNVWKILINEQSLRDLKWIIWDHHFYFTEKNLHWKISFIKLIKYIFIIQIVKLKVLVFARLVFTLKIFELLKANFCPDTTFALTQQWLFM